MAQKKKVYYKYKNIAIALAILLLLMLSIVTACSNDGEKEKDDSSSVADASSVEESKLTSNYKYVSVKNEDSLGKGLLILVNDKHPYTGGEPADIEGVYDYLFDGDGNQIMQASGTGVKGNKSLLTSFNSMINAFYKKTEISNVVINSIYSESSEASESDENKTTVDSPEHSTGYALDLNTYDAENGSYPKFEATGSYSWIGENCWKYGFIQRYTEDKASITGIDAVTNHFRYVGQVHAEIMAKNGLCLEEYLDYLKEYSFEKPLEYECENGGEYVLYYIAAGKDKTTNIPVPLDKNDEEYKYGYSGNNSDGYIVWVKIAQNAVASSSEADSKTEASESTADVSAEESPATDSAAAQSIASGVSAADNSSAAEASSATDDTSADASAQ